MLEVFDLHIQRSVLPDDVGVFAGDGIVFAIFLVKRT